MFIQDPGSGFFISDPVSRVDPDPDPNKRILVFLTQKIGSKDSLIRIPDPGVKMHLIPDPVKEQIIMKIYIFV